MASAAGARAAAGPGAGNPLARREARKSASAAATEDAQARRALACASRPHCRSRSSPPAMAASTAKRSPDVAKESAAAETAAAAP